MVHFSAANQVHAYERHDAEFLGCLPHAAATIIAPDFIGQSPHHPEGFELVRAVGEVSTLGGHILIALTLAIDDQARYAVQSVYPIGRGVIERRLRKRHLFRVE